MVTFRTRPTVSNRSSRTPSERQLELGTCITDFGELGRDFAAELHVRTVLGCAVQVERIGSMAIRSAYALCLCGAKGPETSGINGTDESVAQAAEVAAVALAWRRVDAQHLICPGCEDAQIDAAIEAAEAEHCEVLAKGWREENETAAQLEGRDLQRLVRAVASARC